MKRLTELPSAADQRRLARTIAGTQQYKASEFDTEAGMRAVLALSAANGAGYWKALQNYVHQVYPAKVGETFLSLVDGYDVETDTPVQADNSTKEHPLRRRSILEAATPQPPIQWTVEGIVAPGTVALWYGIGGVGKTYALHDLAIHIAMAIDWCGKAVPVSRPVLFIDEESGVSRFLRRSSSSVRAHTNDFDLPIFFHCFKNWNLREEGKEYDDLTEMDQPGLKALAYIIERDLPALVIIDALVDVTRGGDENSVEDMQPLFYGLRGLADQYQTAIHVIHHANKGGTVRGSTAIGGAVDLMLSVTKVEGVDGRLKIQSEKSRDTEPFVLNVDMRFDKETDTFDLAYVDVGTPVAVVRQNPVNIFIRNYLRDNGDTELSVLAESGGSISSDNIKRTVTRMAQAGEIFKVNDGGRFTRSVYSLYRKEVEDDGSI